MKTFWSPNLKLIRGQIAFLIGVIVLSISVSPVGIGIAISFLLAGSYWAFTADTIQW